VVIKVDGSFTRAGRRRWSPAGCKDADVGGDSGCDCRGWTQVEERERRGPRSRYEAFGWGCIQGIGEVPDSHMAIGDEMSDGALPASEMLL
jgi:hypothetical protein